MGGARSNSSRRLRRLRESQSPPRAPDRSRGARFRPRPRRRPRSSIPPPIVPPHARQPDRTTNARRMSTRPHAAITSGARASAAEPAGPRVRRRRSARPARMNRTTPTNRNGSDSPIVGSSVRDPALDAARHRPRAPPGTIFGRRNGNATTKGRHSKRRLRGGPGRCSSAPLPRPCEAAATDGAQSARGRRDSVPNMPP
jgi:hypothetical protein